MRFNDADEAAGAGKVLASLPVTAQARPGKQIFGKYKAFSPTAQADFKKQEAWSLTWN